MFAFNFQRAPSNPVSCIAISGIDLRERRFCSPQMAVRSLTDQPDRLATRARDADLALTLALPDLTSSAGCRQRRTLTTSDRSAKRRTPTRPILYRRSFQVVRYDGLAKPPPTVCAARCTATLGPGSDKLNWSVTGLYLYRLLSLGLLLLSLSAAVPLACSAGRVGEGGRGEGGVPGQARKPGGELGRALLGLCWGPAGNAVGPPTQQMTY